MQSTNCLIILCAILVMSGKSCLAFNSLFIVKARNHHRQHSLIFVSTNNNEDGSDSSSNENDGDIINDESNADEEESIDDMPIIAQSTVKIDDGGSDLTDRFKYKVNALMGNYDPVQAETDNEQTDGNILQAMLKFPTLYAFNVVGKTGGNDDVTKEYVNDIKDIVLDVTGDKELQCQCIPRGKKFTKITIEAVVESASMINLIYGQLAEHKLTKMRF